MCLANDLACLGEGRPFPIDAFLDLAVVGVIGSALLTGALTRLIQRPPQHRWPLPGQVAGGAFAVGGVHGDVQTGEADRAAGGKTPAGSPAWVSCTRGRGCRAVAQAMARA